LARAWVSALTGPSVSPLTALTMTIKWKVAAADPTLEWSLQHDLLERLRVGQGRGGDRTRGQLRRSPAPSPSPAA
jgi:hypothetical protein